MEGLPASFVLKGGHAKLEESRKLAVALGWTKYPLVKRPLLLLCLLLSCRSSTRDAAGPAAAPVPERIVIAATLPIGSMEGQTARFVREGYELAFEEANLAGGVTVHGKKASLELQLSDDGDDAARGVALLQASKARFFLGSSSPRVIEAQAAHARSQGAPYLVAVGASKAAFERGGRWVFGLQAPVELLAYTQMRWIDEAQKAGRLPSPLSVAVLVEDSSRGHEFRKGVIDFTQKTPSRRLSYRVAFDEQFPAGQVDFIPVLKRLQARKADAFLADASLAEFLALHRQYLSLGLCHKALSYGAHGIELEALEAFGFKGLRRVLSAVWWSNRLARSGPNGKFAESFKATYHRDPDWYAALSYEAARALIQAFRQADSLEAEAVRAALANLRIESILPGGRLLFGADQVAVYPFVVQQIQADGSAPIVFPTDVAESRGDLDIQCR